MFIELHITTQLGPVIFIFQCYSMDLPCGGSVVTCACMCGIAVIQQTGYQHLLGVAANPARCHLNRNINRIFPVPDLAS